MTGSLVSVSGLSELIAQKKGAPRDGQYRPPVGAPDSAWYFWHQQSYLNKRVRSNGCCLARREGAPKEEEEKEEEEEEGRLVGDRTREFGQDSVSPA